MAVLSGETAAAVVGIPDRQWFLFCTAVIFCCCSHLPQFTCLSQYHGYLHFTQSRYLYVGGTTDCLKTFHGNRWLVQLYAARAG